MKAQQLVNYKGIGTNEWKQQNRQRTKFEISMKRNKNERYMKIYVIRKKRSSLYV